MLAALPGLELLFLEGTPVTDDGLKHLEEAATYVPKDKALKDRLATAKDMLLTKPRLVVVMCVIRQRLPAWRRRR